MADSAARVRIRRRAASNERSTRRPKSVRLGVLVGVGLHGLRGEERLGGPRARLGDPVLALAAERAEPPPEAEDRHEHHRHADEHQRGQLRAGEEQEHDAADQHQPVAERHRHRRADDGEDEGGVGRQPRDHLAGHDPLGEGRAEADHPVVDRLADVGDHPLAEARHQVEARRRPERQAAPRCRGRRGSRRRRAPPSSAKKLSTTRRTAIGRLSVTAAVSVSAASASQSVAAVRAAERARARAAARPSAPSPAPPPRASAPSPPRQLAPGLSKRPRAAQATAAPCLRR